MKTAEEVRNNRMEQRKTREEQLREETITKVDEYTEKLFSETETKTSFTEEEMKAQFGNAWMAAKILKEQGFIVEYKFEEATGHLWWKKKALSQFKITIPQEKNKS